jgi:hypothetical protein
MHTYRTYIHTYMNAYIHYIFNTYIQIHTYIHTHIHTYIANNVSSTCLLREFVTLLPHRSCPSAGQGKTRTLPHKLPTAVRMPTLWLLQSKQLGTQWTKRALTCQRITVWPKRPPPPPMARTSESVPATIPTRMANSILMWLCLHPNNSRSSSNIS